MSVSARSSMSASLAVLTAGMLAVTPVQASVGPLALRIVSSDVHLYGLGTINQNYPQCGSSSSTDCGTIFYSGSDDMVSYEGAPTDEGGSGNPYYFWTIMPVNNYDSRIYTFTGTYQSPWESSCGDADSCTSDQKWVLVFSPPSSSYPGGYFSLGSATGGGSFTGVGGPNVTLTNTSLGYPETSFTQSGNRPYSGASSAAVVIRGGVVLPAKPETASRTTRSAAARPTGSDLKSTINKFFEDGIRPPPAAAATLPTQPPGISLFYPNKKQTAKPDTASRTTRNAAARGTAVVSLGPTWPVDVDADPATTQRSAPNRNR